MNAYAARSEHRPFCVWAAFRCLPEWKIDGTLGFKCDPIEFFDEMKSQLATPVINFYKRVKLLSHVGRDKGFGSDLTALSPTRSPSVSACCAGRRKECQGRQHEGTESELKNIVGRLGVGESTEARRVQSPSVLVVGYRRAPVR